MTTEERLHQIIDTWDDSRVEALLVVLASGNSASNGHDLDVARGASGAPAAEPGDSDEWPGPITMDDPLWDIVGAPSGPPDGPGHVARNHDRYLAEAYADNHES